MILLEINAIFKRSGTTLRNTAKVAAPTFPYGVRAASGLVRDPVQLLESTIDRILRPLQYIVLALLFVVLGGVVYFLSTHPVAYQKLMALSIEPVPEVDWEKQERVLAAESVIGAIPYSGSETLALVLPSQLYEATMLNGYGNCANKCRGLSYYLEQRNMRFQRVELLPVDNFIRGSGHVLIRTKYLYRGDQRVGLVDMLEGGLPEKDGSPIDLDQLRQANPFTITIAPLNIRCDRQSDYYGTFLETAVIGVADSEDIRRYFRWVEAVYLPTGNPKLERFLCNASAIVLGRFPRLHVSEADFDRLVAPNFGIFLIAEAMTWATRTLLVLLPITVALMAFRVYRRRSRVARSRHAESQPLANATP